MSPYHIRRPTHSCIATALLLGTVVVLSGCQTTPRGAPARPSLQMLGAQPLKVAENCEVSGSFFVEFTVLSDGRTSEIQAPPGPACMQQALTAWVSTFRYSPPGRQTPTGIEWMMVTARKGT